MPGGWAERKTLLHTIFVQLTNYSEVSDKHVIKSVTFMSHPS